MGKQGACLAFGAALHLSLRTVLFAMLFASFFLPVLPVLFAMLFASFFSIMAVHGLLSHSTSSMPVSVCSISYAFCSPDV